MLKLHEILRQESDVLSRLASKLADSEIPDGYEDEAFDVAVSSVVLCAARLLHAVGEHDFNLDDHPSH